MDFFSLKLGAIPNRNEQSWPRPLALALTNDGRSSISGGPTSGRRAEGNVQGQGGDPPPPSIGPRLQLFPLRGRLCLVFFSSQGQQSGSEWYSEPTALGVAAASRKKTTVPSSVTGRPISGAAPVRAEGDSEPTPGHRSCSPLAWGRVDSVYHLLGFLLLCGRGPQGSNAATPTSIDRPLSSYRSMDLQNTSVAEVRRSVQIGCHVFIHSSLFFFKLNEI